MLSFIHNGGNTQAQGTFGMFQSTVKKPIPKSRGYEGHRAYEGYKP